MFTSYAPSIINLGVSVTEIIKMVSKFITSLANELKDTRKKLSKKNNKYVLTGENSSEFETFQLEKKDQVSKSITTAFNDKLKNGIVAPVLNFAANQLINKGIESVAGADRVERLATTFELIHAASNPDDTKTKYADDLNIFLAEAKPIDLSKLNVDPKKIRPANLNGQSLQEAYDLYGDKVKTFVDKEGRVYVRRPTSKEYYQSVRGDKPAGLHEQKKIQEALGCEIKKETTLNNEQKCTLCREGGKNVDFLIKNNTDGSKHACLIVDGQEMDVPYTSNNKNDCYYNVALVANEMSKGSSYEDAVKSLDEAKVKGLRNSVSVLMKNDVKLLKELSWTNNRADLNSHFTSLTGIRHEANSNTLYFSLKEAKILRNNINNYTTRPDKFRPGPRHKISSAKYQHEQFQQPQIFSVEVDVNGNLVVDAKGNVVYTPMSLHHMMSAPLISQELKADISKMSNKQLRTAMNDYLNHPLNARLKELVITQIKQSNNTDHAQVFLIYSDYILET